MKTNVVKQSDPSRKIKTKKRGNKLGFWFFKVSLYLFGLYGAYGLLYIVCFYYVIFDRPAVSSSLAYIEKRFPNCSFLKKRLHVYLLFVSQGKQLIDRYAVISEGGIFDIQLTGYEHFMSLIQNSAQGLILLTAHVGNWQMALTTLKKTGRTVYLLMRPEDNRAVQNSLNISHEQSHLRIISPEQYLGGVVEIMKVLNKGHIVSIMGDRNYGTNTLEVSFLGKKALFPTGAFAIAAAAKCPVVVLLATKVSAYRYSIDVSNIFYPRYQGSLNKNQQIRQWVQKFAVLLETYIKRHPYQCFLFHDVWKDDLKTSS